MNMHAVWRIEHFLAIVSQGSFAAAARHANMTQPALTKSIRQLEATLGVELLARLPTGVRLTEAGRTFHRHATTIHASWNAALTELAVQATGHGGQITIGGGPVYSTVIFPRMLHDLADLFPGLEIRVRTGSADEMLPMVRNGDLLCYAGLIPNLEGAMSREIESVEILRQSNAIYAAKGHPLFGRPQIEAEDLLDHRWLTLFNAHRANADLERYFATRGLQSPRVTLRVHSIQVALRMLSDHRYLTCLPTPLGEAFGKTELRKIDVPNFSDISSTGLTYKKSAADFLTIRKISTLLRSIAGDAFE